MDTNSLKLVIFDMDGVIVDSEPIHFKSEKESFISLGIVVSKKEHESYVGMDQRGIWKEIKRRHKLFYSEEELIEKHIKILTTYIIKENLKPMDGVIELFDELEKNGIKKAVASSSPRKLIENILKRFGIYENFDFVISGEEVEKGKPEPDIFKQVAYTLGIQSNNAVVIEDSENGVKAAKEAGMKCIGFENPNSGMQNLSMADKVVKNFRELSLKNIIEIL